MQIRELILYGHNNNKIRRISFALGKVNIITGSSKTGKSVIGDIIEYCLGGNSCNIADGVVRDNVAWYGLLLQFEHERMFVARMNPEAGQQTTTACYFEIGESIEAPLKCDFSSNINVTELEELLSRRIGIADNLNIPPEGQTRQPLSANIRHSLYYCFQGQDEIAAKNFLFHRQQEPFIPQSIKDTMPYFLGAISENALALEKERARLRQELKRVQRNLDENRNIIDNGSKKAIELIEEARQVGIIDPSIKYDPQNSYEIYNTLKKISNWNSVQPTMINEEMAQLTELQNKLQDIKNEYSEICATINNAKIYSGETKDFSGEAEYQKKRLESIGLFESLNFDSNKCPFCSGTLEKPIPNIEMIKNAIANLEKSITNVTRTQPKLISFIQDLENERSEKQEEIKKIKAQIDAIYQKEDDAKRIRDINTRAGIVIGRISLWIESVEDDEESPIQEQKIEAIKKRINDIDNVLDLDSVEERTISALSRIQQDMTNFAKDLKLEHAGNPYRLDLRKLTVAIDKPDRTVFLKQLGSGSNWVGLHLISYFALHHFYITSKRPVPRFLFLDQPSQVYFPSESSENNNNRDDEEVRNIYRFIIDQVDALNHELQVIIVDHADFEDDFFKANLCEYWWHDNTKLIPVDWYTTKH